MYRYAIIGFGGLGKLHLTNLLQLEKERAGDLKLCAICGADKETFLSNVQLNLGAVDISSVDFSECGFYQDYKELIEKEKPDFILATLPTHLHEEVALYALGKGVHVFSEKPMALSVESCDRMIAAAKESGQKLMIGHVLRFAPVYAKLKEFVDTGVYGKARRFEFCRYSQTPLWTWQNWILDPEKSGGVIIDMHIHDVDIINWMFGKPKAVYSVGTENKTACESVFTTYEYDDLLITGGADWSMTQKFPFTCRALMNFEKATVVLEDDKLMVYTDEEAIAPELPDVNMHYQEIKSFIEWVIDDIPCDGITSPESIRDSVLIAKAEAESVKTGKQVVIG